MRANPGGMVDPAEVVGRDGLIAELWRILETRSLVLDGERRLGKTCIVRKMAAEAPAGVVAAYRDLEGLRSPEEFVEAVLRDGLAHLGRLGRAAWRVKRLAGKLGGVEIKGKVKLPAELGPHWKPLLEDFVAALAGTGGPRVVFFWDEVPLMLQNLRRRSGAEQALEVLDVLRGLRQSQPGLRMVFTGSIGLRGLIGELEEGARSADPTNDMALVEVPPLAPADARALARALLDGEGLGARLEADQRDAVLAACAERIAALSDGVPYYIHHVVDRLAQGAAPPTPQAAEAVVERCLHAPDDPWHLRHFVERLEPSYGRARAALARRVLDLVAHERSPAGRERIHDLLATTGRPAGAGELDEVLALLARDHYLRAEGRPPRYRFRFGLLARWWRGLAPGARPQAGTEEA